MTREMIKKRMAHENTVAIEPKETPEGIQNHVLKRCYHCGKHFIARRHNALTCRKTCSTNVSRKLKRGHDLSGKFKLGSVGDTIEFDKYPTKKNW